ncbi:MAG: ParA family protein, partial [Candidatus Heimdallarchaeaceae archaeon]
MSKFDFSDQSNLSSTRLDIIILHSQKGGPGKTTLSCNIAKELARRGNKTVIIDLD